MVAPALEEILDGLDRESVMLLVLALESAACYFANFALPTGPGVLPVIEIVLILPDCLVADA